MRHLAKGMLAKLALLLAVVHSNRRIELLDVCVSMLDRGDRSDLAARILERYTTVDPVSPKGWRGWLDANPDGRRQPRSNRDEADSKHVVRPVR